MRTTALPIKPLAFAALLAIAGSSHAAITVVTSLAAFNAATVNPGTDTYTGFSITGGTPSPITRNAGPYTYTADAGPAGTFFGAGTTANPWLSTNTATDTISFFGFTPGVVGLGGNFFGSNISGLFAAGDVVVTATDASGTVSQTIVNATTGSFLGFVSTTGLLSATVAAVQVPGASPLWPTVDNLVLASAVPEPGTYALMLAGVGVLGFMARRRRG
jgi:hypothetical protein